MQIPCGLAALVPLVLAQGALHAADLIVDAAGLSSPYTTIEAAMVASSPGDRILVLPGSYPAFHFSRGVSVIGLGPDPSAVVIARVDYHVNLPPFGYDTLLSNVSICGSGPGDAISIGGNELAPGTLTLHGVTACGGVFLHGDSAFSLLSADSSFVPGPGGGFAGAAFDFGGGSLDLVQTRIAGWDASPADGAGAGIGLRLKGGVSARVTGAEIRGGSGVPESGLFEPGAHAIAGWGPSPPVSLVLAGGSVVRGGDGAALGAAGDGVALVGALEQGDALVAGGGGLVPGAAYGLDPAVLLGFDPELRVEPSQPFGAGPIALAPGMLVSVKLDASVPGPVALGFSFALEPPQPPIPTLLAAPVALVFAHEATLAVPSAGGFLPGLQAFAQGFHLDPLGASVRVTNAVTVRLDI